MARIKDGLVTLLTASHMVVATIGATVGILGFTYWNFKSGEEELIKDNKRAYAERQEVHPSQAIFANGVFQEVTKQNDIVESRPNFLRFLFSGQNIWRTMNDTTLAGHIADDIQPAYSPDGNWLAFLSNRDGNGVGSVYQLWLLNRSTRELRQITNETVDVKNPRWVNPTNVEVHLVEEGIGTYKTYDLGGRLIIKEVREGTNIGDVALNFKLKGLDGKVYELSRYRREMPVVLNFWETWCRPCIEEHPSLNVFAQEYAGKFAVLTLTKDDKGDTQYYVEHNGYSFPVLIDKDRNIFLRYANRGIPHTVIIDKVGRIIYVHVGDTDFNDPKSEVRRTIDDLLSKQK